MKPGHGLWPGWHRAEIPCEGTSMEHSVRSHIKSGGGALLFIVPSMALIRWGWDRRGHVTWADIWHGEC